MTENQQKAVQVVIIKDTFLKYAAQALQLHMAESDHFHQSQVQY